MVTQAQTTNPQEISTRDVEPTFKLQSERNMVMVRVVVRDSEGQPVDNLRQEDFRLFEHGKPQTILHFSVEKPAVKSPAAPPSKAQEKEALEPEDADETSLPVNTARRFVALYFDDVNTPFENLVRTRDAADHFLTHFIQAGDRVGLFTSSGQKQVAFTDNLAQLHQALLDIRPRPIVEREEICGEIPPYQAYLILDQRDPTAIAVATEEAKVCNKGTQLPVETKAQFSLQASETQSRAALRGIESIVRALTTFPGQRSLVIVSGGFLTETLRFELSQISDRALRAGVIINAIDARGLYTDSTLDAERSSIAISQNGQIIAEKQMIMTQGDRAEASGMRDLALDTDGIFFENSNDLDAGFQKTAAVPEVSYVLSFSPQNLKLDGSFHPLQVKLVAAKGLPVQARRG